MSKSIYDQVVDRIDNTPELQPYRDTILYDWPEPGSLKWALTAPVAEIVDWAQVVEQE